MEQIDVDDDLPAFLSVVAVPWKLNHFQLLYHLIQWLVTVQKACTFRTGGVFPVACRGYDRLVKNNVGNSLQAFF
jgi:hypothetical protein